MSKNWNIMSIKSNTNVATSYYKCVFNRILKRGEITMYNNLLAEMNRRGLHIYDLQKIINVGRGTAYSKMAGKTDWTLQEMLKVQDFFNDGLNQFDKLTLDYLFKGGNNDRKAERTK